MEQLTIANQKYISSKRAAEVMGYTQDYIGQLCRGGKLSAQRVGGVWYVNELAVGRWNHKSSKDIKQEVDKFEAVVTIANQKYISSKRAAEVMGYTQDYIGQLCRGGKLSAKQINRSWYIPELVLLGTQQGIKKDSVLNEIRNTEETSMYTLPASIYSPDVRPLIPTLQEVVKDEYDEVPTTTQVDTFSSTQEVNIPIKVLEKSPLQQVFRESAQKNYKLTEVNNFEEIFKDDDEFVLTKSLEEEPFDDDEFVLTKSLEEEPFKEKILVRKSFVFTGLLLLIFTASIVGINLTPEKFVFKDATFAVIQNRSMIQDSFNKKPKGEITLKGMKSSFVAQVGRLLEDRMLYRSTN